MENEKSEEYDVEPYLDAFSFFKNNNKIVQEFINNTNFGQDEEDKKTNFKIIFDNIIQNILINNEDTDEIKQQKKLFRKCPKKVFDILLNELHKIFRSNETLEHKIKSAEFNKDNALKDFKIFLDKDKSYISENFFGIKSIEKKCQDCQMTQHTYNYLKAIPLNIKELKEEKDIDLEKCLKKIQTPFTIECFCPMCSSRKLIDINIKIEKFPKILILVLYGNENYAKYKIKKGIKHGKYELIAAEVKKKNSFFDIFSFLCKKKNNYEFINIENDIDNNEYLFEDNDKTPIVLFYKQRERMINDQDTGGESMSSIRSSLEGNYEAIKSEEVKIINKVSMINNSPEKKEINASKADTSITLDFKFSQSGKEIYIKTKSNELFYKIIKDLEEKYAESNIIIIDKYKIAYNNNIIQMDKTPSDYNINQDCHLTIIE